MALAESVNAALLAHPVGERDRAVADLARFYASELDGGGDAAKLGPALLTTLEALQMSPRARALAQRGKAADDKPADSELDELRARRAGKGRAATVDAAAP
ncbi:hypothetical protein [Micromonospora zamorensis]|uniref:hypothetical protein n=1 Tax=Micromonospora zamorensis TaxID=709883 RepID=UPI000B5AFB63|nr:hypothetical protein [Micromonospora zamorensis]